MNLCVYCSSSDSIDPKYFTVAEALGALLARRGDTLVYGGASVGLMGTIARSVHAGGGRVVGVIPQALVDREIAYRTADELLVTPNMRERKALMEARADAFLALPGGIGTLEEISEIMVGKHLRLIAKPLVLLDTDGFYQPLLALFEHMRAAQFIKTPFEQLFHFAPDLEAAFAYIDAQGR
jgi:uncharacterized protein (TIGR00730 family)